MRCIDLKRIGLFTLFVLFLTVFTVNAFSAEMVNSLQGNILVENEAGAPGEGAEGLQVGRFQLTGTNAAHAAERLPNGQLVRPYMTSPNTIEEIMATGAGKADPQGVAGALRWDVPGTFRGNEGAWELVVRDNEILHFLFRSGQ
jgi:hypothetical protein